ncbi:ChbG/HpnK family deacetylase [Paenibacillus dendritiformis]|uniref:ChbG/HpnK family deacetylase n=1 Tax=Paenibacillus dendritiformis TaxID=130049 RepID=UPI00143DDAC4|nr:ChbG/HpnK family deacetylase [Paenibacillus dendritiformis]NKI22096.1 ChbG/HpnK family deacetylase [Paenibacillus dendritiformis]NRF98715.1 ChbG/HpnK family deacetylase [Paenibacillus dendritiformis]
MLSILGYSSGDRVLIIQADNAGHSAEANEAAFELLESGAVTCASLITVAGHSLAAAKRAVAGKNASIGIHLTLTGGYRPRSAPDRIPSLLDKGRFPDSLSQLEKQADPYEVRHELANQIEWALKQGLKPTHLDSHQGSVLGLFAGNDFLDAVFDLCDTYELPFLLPRNIVRQSFLTQAQRRRFEYMINEARERNIALIDDLLPDAYGLAEAENYESYREGIVRALAELKPGITQWTLHPERYTASYPQRKHQAKREMEYRIAADPAVQDVLAREGIKLISWQPLQQWQHEQAAAASKRSGRGKILRFG